MDENLNKVYRPTPSVKYGPSSYKNLTQNFLEKESCIFDPRRHDQPLPKPKDSSSVSIEANFCQESLDGKNPFPPSKPDTEEPKSQRISDGKPNVSSPTIITADVNELPWLRYTKLTVLVVIWLLCTIILITKKEKVSNLHQISVPPDQTKASNRYKQVFAFTMTPAYLILDRPLKHQISVVIQGALLPNYYANLSSRWMNVWVEVFEARVALEISTPLEENHITNSVIASDFWTVPLVLEELLDIVPELTVKKVFDLSEFDSEIMSKCFIRIHFETNLKSSFPISIGYDMSPINIEDGVLYAALVLLGLYLSLMFEIVHRTLAAMLAATTSVAILAALDERPSIAELASWIDFETLLLLFSMMLLVGIFAETGIFDYIAVCAFKMTKGKIWPLITTLCFSTAFLSSFLDNVTTALLMTPVTIRLCEVMGLNPVPVLMAIMIFSNIGGAITPVGDPPNVIVASHPDVINAGVDFGVFFLHMFIGISLVSFVVYCQLRFMFRDKKVFAFAEPHHVQELRHDITNWQSGASSLTAYSKDQDCEKGTLLKNYPIRNWPLLYKSSFALFFVICVFFLHSIPELNLSLGCTAFLGAMLLLILADKESMEGVLSRVEWSTLLFFASLFILMEALSRLRLIEWIGKKTEQLIFGVDTDYQLSVAIILILWVSACVSAFVDNIPLTTMMIKIITSLAQNPQLDLPLMPLVWSLCFGACLGGVATLIGSSSNVVCAGVAEQHSYRFTFMDYFKVGFPVMIVSVTVCTIYLLIAHVALQWNT